METSKCEETMNVFIDITRPNCALGRRTFLCVYVLGFQRLILKHVKVLSARSMRMKEQKKKKGSVILAESADNSPKKTQFSIVIVINVFINFCLIFKLFLDNDYANKK